MYRFLTIIQKKKKNIVIFLHDDYTISVVAKIVKNS